MLLYECFCLLDWYFEPLRVVTVLLAELSCVFAEVHARAATLFAREEGLRLALFRADPQGSLLLTSAQICK